ncbi:hypothetical protein M9Y10_029255 [Tritrichomonas musculus]|uniref:MULE transposase domain-containing protein n=1 Tax=Tritrichomonas musculus TaxID=1915356 RepID=A0ABR2KM34_9EUKA
MNGNTDYDCLSFQTHYFLSDAFDSNHSLKHFDVFPEKLLRWDFTTLSCFLNEFKNFEKSSRFPFENIQNNDYNTIFRFVDKNNKGCSFEVRIGETIQVIGTKDFLNAYFIRKTKSFYSTLRQWCRFRTKPIFQEHTYYIFTIDEPEESTKNIFEHKPLYFNSKEDFSQIFQFFAQNISANLPENFDTISIKDFNSLFSKSWDMKINTFEKFQTFSKVFLCLNIQKTKIKKRLTKIVLNGEEYTIISGIYILPDSESIISENNIIDGMLLDTTWKILPNYDTSILMGSSMNTGIPLSFAFGEGETKELYNLHFKHFKSLFNIDLERFNFESDQGVSLLSIFKEKSINYFVCLRHLLVNLKFNEFSYAIKNIIFCCTEFELQRSIEFYSNIFSKVTDPQKVNLRDQILKKVGLSFIQNKIEITDPKRWQQVSLIQRKEYRMPSTTNSLESTHGHLNHEISRRKNFWKSMFKISNHLIQKVNTFQQNVQHNYNYQKKKDY